MGQRVPSLGALGVALLLVASPLYLFPHAGKAAYHHELEPIPPGGDALAYESLSPEAKAAIRDAQTDDGIVYGRANRPPEFVYSDHIAPGYGIYYVERNGTYYELTTYAGGGILPFDLFLEVGLVLLGLGVALVATDRTTVERRRLRLGVAAYGGVMLVASTVPTPTAVRLWLIPGAVVGAVACLLTVGYLRWRS